MLTLFILANTLSPIQAGGETFWLIAAGLVVTLFLSLE